MIQLKTCQLGSGILFRQPDESRCYCSIVVCIKPSFENPETCSTSGWDGVNPNNKAKHR